jgi:acyl carrier protein
VITTSYELSPNDGDRTPPIGRPISNTTVVIVDSQRQVVPVGVAGELCVGGEGLARGYLNQEVLTAQKFVTIDLHKETSQKMYCTGDVGRWLEDGTIEYLGRKDDQVKIRGYRIELGEIESVLLQTGLVSQAIVLIKEDGGGDKQLVAYVVAEPTVQTEMLISHLRGKLPQYMVPSLWVRLESLPLTPNGKIDRKALPEPETSDLISEQYVAPQTQVEQSLANIWKELLHIEKVGIRDNFFKLGGHSLLARRMVSHIERNLAVSVPIHILFQLNTIGELGKYLEIQLNNHPRGKDPKGFKVVNI